MCTVVVILGLFGCYVYGFYSFESEASGTERLQGCKGAHWEASADERLRARSIVFEQFVLNVYVYSLIVYGILMLCLIANNHLLSIRKQWNDDNFCARR